MEIKNQNGQASIEMVIASMALILFFSFFICLIYLASSYTLLRYSSHEYLLCPEYQQKFICLKNFDSALRQILRFGEIQKFKIQETPSQRNLSFSLTLKILNIQKIELKYQDQIQIPVSIK